MRTALHRGSGTRCRLQILVLSLAVVASHVTATDVIVTLAGNGEAGFGGDGGPATSANLNYAWGVALDPSGGVVIADTQNHRIRKVVAGGNIITIAGNGTADFSGDGGPALNATLNEPTGVAVDAFGNIYIADSGNHRVRRIAAATGIITTVAGNGAAGLFGDGGPAVGASLNYPTHVTPDGFGNFYIADSSNHRVRKVTYTGTISTFAGDGVAGYGGDGGPATSASLNFPSHVSLDPAGNLLIADRENHRIRRVNVVDGVIVTAAGDGIAADGGDGGLAIGTHLFRPFSVTSDAGGNFFIADSDNCRIRKVSAASGKINTVAGNGQGGYNGDDNNAKAAKLAAPVDVFTDRFGTFFIADLNNFRIRGVNVEGAPAVNAGPDRITSTMVFQDAITSNAISLQWQMVAGPPGGSLVFSNPNAEDTDISATMDGIYVARLVATAINETVAYDDIIFTWDTTAPVIQSDITIEATGSSGAMVNFIPAVDNLDPTPVTDSSHDSGVFPIGSTLVTVSSTDWAGNSASGSFTITVQDTTAPVISNVPADIFVEADTTGGSIVDYPPVTASDDVTADPSITYSMPSGSLFPVGVTVVTITATDDDGNSSQATFTVTVQDGTPPALSVPEDIVVEAAGPEGTAVTYPPATATDAQTANPVIAYSQESGTMFPLGQTTVTVTATDDAGNSVSDSFTITVQDTTPPVIGGGAIINGNMTVEATGPDGAVVTFVGAVDAVDPNPSVDATPPSGSTFPLGVTTVNVVASDAAGNSTNGSFTVTVVDTTAPVVIAPADMVVEATSPAGADVSFPAVSVTDAVTLEPVVSFDPASGSTLAMGVTTVQISATDEAGNVGSAGFTVTVQDTTPPVIGGGSIIDGNMTVEATGPDGAVVTFVGAYDSADPNPTITADPSSGSTFPLGVTAVSVVVTDASGNTTAGGFTVTVVDTTPPVLSDVPGDMVVEGNASGGAMLDYPAATATDVVTLSPAIDYSHPSGTLVSLGDTTVTVTASDEAGNITSGSFMVTVIDTTPPVIGGGAIINGNMTVEATGPNGAKVNFVGAVDTVDPNPAIVATPPSGSTFPLGVTTVYVTATDASGNATSGSFTITVVDTTPPVISNVPAAITIASDNNAGMNASYSPATATDLVSTPVLSYSKASGALFPVGPTTVTISAKDAAGNTSTASFLVTIAPDITPPSIISGPTATPNPALVNTVVLFSCTVLDSKPVVWAWNFGDGTGAGTADNVGHAYSAPGSYTVTLTVTDASGLNTVRSLNMVVEQASAPAVAPIDTDGDGIPDDLDPDDDNDGYSDEEEIAAGTDPKDPNSFPKKPMIITKLVGSAKFNSTGRDGYSIAGVLPNMPAGFDPSGKTFTLDVGGALGKFKLDAKGRAKSANGTFRLKMKFKKNKSTKKKEFIGGPVQFQARLKKGNWVPEWKDEGINPKESKKKAKLPIMADLTFDKAVYTNKVESDYNAKADRAGVFKYRLKRRK